MEKKLHIRALLLFLGIGVLGDINAATTVQCLEMPIANCSVGSHCIAPYTVTTAGGASQAYTISTNVLTQAATFNDFIPIAKAYFDNQGQGRCLYIPDPLSFFTLVTDEIPGVSAQDCTAFKETNPVNIGFQCTNS